MSGQGSRIADDGYRHLVLALTESGCAASLADWIASTLAPMVQEGVPQAPEGVYYRPAIERAVWRAMLGRGHTAEQAAAVIESVTAWLWMPERPIE